MRPGWEQLCPPWLLLCSRARCFALISGARSGFQITSKAVFFWFQSVFGQGVLAVGWHSLCTEVGEQSCVPARWSRFSRKGCPCLTALHYLRHSFSQPVSWPECFNFSGAVLTKPVACCCYFPSTEDLQNVITFLFLQVAELPPAFINSFAVSRSSSCCCLGRGCVSYHPPSQKVESNI